ncbi:MAG: fumarylacetoacetate hydrolase family protein [Actinomycetota bacterium]|nr:fumarylacetoacetate hydrolase family protein [Actinomycetota bacterium]
MRLTTVRTEAGTAAGRVEGDEIVELPYADVGALLAQADWAGRATAGDGRRHPLAGAALATLVPRPPKIICVGLNYRSHILEMGRELPEHPTLFAKYTNALLGPTDDLVIPAGSDQVDWEVELGVVLGAPGRRVSAEQALGIIAGYTVVNDISMRDWQWRTGQWLQGKTFEASTPVGPVLVTPDEVDHGRDLALTCSVDGVGMQSSRTSDLLFSPAQIVAYISQFTTLQPGDLIATGTPGGVGAGRDPQVFLHPGQVVTTTIEGIGSLENACVADDGGGAP